MILDLILATIVLISVVTFVVAWKKNVVPTRTQKLSQAKFYDDNDYEDEHVFNCAPKFCSDFKNLDERVSGAVRYNQSMYYTEDEFQKIKEDVLKRNFPI